MPKSAGAEAARKRRKEIIKSQRGADSTLPVDATIAADVTGAGAGEIDDDLAATAAALAAAATSAAAESGAGDTAAADDTHNNNNNTAPPPPSADIAVTAPTVAIAAAAAAAAASAPTTTTTTGGEADADKKPPKKRRKKDDNGSGDSVGSGNGTATVSAGGKKAQIRYDPDVPMSKEQLAAWRREARRVRNRESAAASRQRIRDRITELEVEVEDWKGKYNEAIQRLEALEKSLGGGDQAHHEV